MTVPSRAELREWAANLHPEEPLDVGDPAETRNVPLMSAYRFAEIEEAYGRREQALALYQEALVADHLLRDQFGAPY